MVGFHKYVRTPHIRGSRFQHGDHDLEAVPWEELVGKRLVIEEKVDGANAGISFDEDGKLLIQTRGHYLRGGPREKHFNLLKVWANARQDELRQTLGNRYVMYGEWLYAKHTMYYDALPHYFMEFDVLDLEQNVFLSTPARDKLLRFASDVTVPVKVLAVGEFKKLDEVASLIKLSNFITAKRLVHLAEAANLAGVATPDALDHTDLSTEMEGLYIKWEDQHQVLGRYKFVRSSFTNAILDQEEHWHDRLIIPNRLEPGAYERMFT
jgi:hypothetical protein